MSEPSNEPTITPGQVEEFDAEGGMSLVELVSRALRDAQPGQHYWVINLQYHLADPVAAWETMELGMENMIGPSDIFCRFCGRQFLPGMEAMVCRENPLKS